MGKSPDVPNMQPIVTQCLQGMKIKGDRGLDQYCGNVSMKVHCKLGGVTHQIRIPALDSRTMMIGADVCPRSALSVIYPAQPAQGYPSSSEGRPRASIDRGHSEHDLRRKYLYAPWHPVTRRPHVGRLRVRSVDCELKVRP